MYRFLIICRHSTGLFERESDALRMNGSQISQAEELDRAADIRRAKDPGETWGRITHSGVIRPSYEIGTFTWEFGAGGTTNTALPPPPSPFSIGNGGGTTSPENETGVSKYALPPNGTAADLGLDEYVRALENRNLSLDDVKRDAPRVCNGFRAADVSNRNYSTWCNMESNFMWGDWTEHCLRYRMTQFKDTNPGWTLSKAREYCARDCNNRFTTLTKEASVHEASEVSPQRAAGDSAYSYAREERTDGLAMQCTWDWTMMKCGNSHECIHDYASYVDYKRNSTNSSNASDPGDADTSQLPPLRFGWYSELARV